MAAPEIVKERRALMIATIIAVVFGAYFLRNFFGLIVFAAILAFLFDPVYKRLAKRFKRRGSAAALTLIISLLAIIVPLLLIILATVVQIKSSINNLSSSNAISDVTQAGQHFVDWFNHVVTKIPGVDTITVQEFQNSIKGYATNALKTLLDLITGSISGISTFITEAIIFMYVFVNLLIFQDSLLAFIKHLNPMGSRRTSIYLEKMASMTKAMAKGQFIIASVQGLTDALLLYIAGFKNVFVLMFLVLTVLSIIPLGGGIIVIPVGIGLLLTGHIWQGALVLLGHFLLVTNEDNFLRPKLVPKDSHLNPALTLLSVFAGIGMFGFLGIIIGPVIMILIVSTLKMYLESSAEAEKHTA